MAQRFLQIAVLALLCLMLAGIVMWAWFNHDHLTGLAFFRDDKKAASVNTGGVALGGPFTLVNQDGITVTEKDFAEQWRLMFFGFTHCPDVCPTKLTAIADVMKMLGSDAKRVVPIFVTLDPQRDTVTVMRGYVRAFSDDLVGLTGTPEQIQSVIKNYRVYAQKILSSDTPDASYSIDHSAFSYLIAPDNTFVDVMSYDTTPEDMVATIRRHINK